MRRLVVFESGRASYLKGEEAQDHSVDHADVLKMLSWGAFR